MIRPTEGFFFVFLWLMTLKQLTIHLQNSSYCISDQMDWENVPLQYSNVFLKDVSVQAELLKLS